MKLRHSQGFSLFRIMAFFAGTASLSFPTSNFKVHETSMIPSHFKYIGPVSPHECLDLQVALFPRDISGLEIALYGVSDPSSPKYGQHLTKEEVDHFFRPTETSVASVIAWLRSYRLNSQSTGLITRFSATAEVANEMFAANFSAYVDDTGQQVVRTDSYSLPEDLSPLISHVHPTVAFPLPRKTIIRREKKNALKVQENHTNNRMISTDCLRDFTLSCVGALYGLPQNTTMSPQNPYQLSVFGLGNAVPSPANLTAFIDLYRTDLATSNISFTYEAMDSSASENNDANKETSPEADLDVEYTVSLTGSPVVYTANSDSTVNAFLTTALTLLDQHQIPSVLSISYGADEYFVGANMATSICNAFMALGARGVSVLVASGDGGVSGIQYDPSCFYYQPTFPASCPFVTSVGGTAISNDNHEIAANLSSGGFSSIFPRPDYQNDAVNHFLEANSISNSYSNSSSSLFNTTNRAFPDIAAIAQNLALIDDQGLTIGDGTSFATPIVASVIAIINFRRSQDHKPALGFLNPTLYANRSMFYDIVEGNNPGCGTNGFSALEGWDPVTGMGTPNFENMLQALG